MRRLRSFISLCALLLVVLAGTVLTGCPAGGASTPPLVSTRAYSGHENDQDANNFVRAYPTRVGSRLDDCQLCHRAPGVSTAPSSSADSITNACTYCHLIPFGHAGYTSGTIPVGYADTLNQFGLDYLNNGRSIAAFSAIASMDSDGDGATNADEINDNRFPGSNKSKPGQPFAPTTTLTLAQVGAMTQHPEFLLLNASKQQYDFYATYNGPRLKDLLLAAGVSSADLASATGVSVFAPDGFKQPFSQAELDDSYYPDVKFYEVTPLADPTLNFVTYPSPLPTCPWTGSTYKDGDDIIDACVTSRHNLRLDA